MRFIKNNRFKVSNVTFILFSFLIVQCTRNEKNHEKTPKTELEKISYALGQDYAKSLDNFKKYEVEVDPDFIVQATLDKLKYKKSLMTDKDIEKYIQKFYKEARDNQEKQLKKLAAESLKREQEYLANNLKNKGVKETKSGLQYKIIRDVKGKKPKDESIITVAYQAKLINGQIIDIRTKDKPAKLIVKTMIPGFREGLKMMDVGSKWRFFIPFKLAYGKKTISKKIPQFSTLIYEVDLLEIKGSIKAKK